jgi:hypothetical protein
MQPVTGEPLLKNVTVPVAVDGVTAAANVTGPTGGGGLGLTVTEIADDELDAAPMTMFDPLLTALESCDVAKANQPLSSRACILREV